MIEIKFPPHKLSLSVLYKDRDDDTYKVMTIRPSELPFVLQLPDSARLVGEIGLDKSEA